MHPKQLEQVRRRQQQGHSIRELSDQFNIPKSTIHRSLKYEQETDDCPADTGREGKSC